MNDSLEGQEQEEEMERERQAEREREQCEREEERQLFRSHYKALEEKMQQTVQRFGVEGC